METSIRLFFLQSFERMTSLEAMEKGERPLSKRSQPNDSSLLPLKVGPGVGPGLTRRRTRFRDALVLQPPEGPLKYFLHHRVVLQGRRRWRLAGHGPQQHWVLLLQHLFEGRELFRVHLPCAFLRVPSQDQIQLQQPPLTRAVHHPSCRCRGRCGHPVAPSSSLHDPFPQRRIDPSPSHVAPPYR